VRIQTPYQENSELKTDITGISSLPCHFVETSLIEIGLRRLNLISILLRFLCLTILFTN